MLTKVTNTYPWATKRGLNAVGYEFKNSFNFKKFPQFRNIS